GDLVVRDDRCLAALRDRQRVARVILVPMRHQNEIACHVGRLERRHRIVIKISVDEQPRPRGLDEKARVTEVGEFHPETTNSVLRWELSVERKTKQCGCLGLEAAWGSIFQLSALNCMSPAESSFQPRLR